MDASRNGIILKCDLIEVSNISRSEKYSQWKTVFYSIQYKNGFLAALLLLTLRNQLSSIHSIIIQWNLSKADTYGTELIVRFKEVSALERFELKSSQI